MMKVEFNELPNNSFTYMGISSDIIMSVVIDNIPIGIVYLSDVMDEGIYIEWLEIFDAFHGKKLLRPIMVALYSKYGKLYFEAPEDLIEKYEHIGAQKGIYDEDSEMTTFVYAA